LTTPASIDPRGAPHDSYRAEIDGLRAVAVLAVLLFHVGVPGFGGGFVGVDVFFVISGYLITRLILGELDRERFTFARFYGRRARRLFPALFVTLAATLAGGIVLLSPLHLEDLALSLVYTLLSLSNVFFWTQAGYFDTASEFKPLIHTWSLGVEEQFYLVWPLSVVLAYRLRRRTGVLALIVAVGLSSLVAAEYAAGTAPDAAFLLTPFRICELALGAACLWLETPVTAPRWCREVLTLAGLAAIAYTVHTYSRGHRFPGLAAMLPCVGAALVIVAGRAPFSGAVLANRVAVGIGLISYSLYLVHWPLLTLRRYGRPAAWSRTEMGAIIAGSFVLATAMYFVVERPFRRRVARSPRLSDPAFGLACAGLAAALVLPSVATLAARGWPARVPESLRAAAAAIPTLKDLHFVEARAQDKKPFPAPGRRNAMIVGDSHGADLLTGLQRAGSQVNYRLLQIQWGCQPIFGDRPYGGGTPVRSREIADACRQQGELLKDNPQLRAADDILIASAWLPYGLAGLPATVEYMKAHYRAHIVLLGARYNFADPSALLIRVSTIDGADQRFDASKDAVATQVEADRLSAIAQHAGVEFIDLRPYVCDPNATGWFCPLFADGELLYWDFHHWTPAGAQRGGRRLRASGRYSFLF
jgi:peptidoglycan/LPS O-acetylase OafA/YrhL